MDAMHFNDAVMPSAWAYKNIIAKPEWVKRRGRGEREKDKSSLNSHLFRVLSRHAVNIYGLMLCVMCLHEYVCVHPYFRIESVLMGNDSVRANHPRCEKGRKNTRTIRSVFVTPIR